MACLVLRAALQNGGFAVPHPVEVKARQGLGHDWGFQSRLTPVASAVGGHVHPFDLALARPGQAGDVVKTFVQQHLAA